MPEDINTTGYAAFPIGEFNVGMVGITTSIYPFSILESLSFLADEFSSFGRLRTLWRRIAAPASITPERLMVIAPLAEATCGSMGGQNGRPA